MKLNFEKKINNKYNILHTQVAIASTGVRMHEKPKQILYSFIPRREKIKGAYLILIGRRIYFRIRTNGTGIL